MIFFLYVLCWSSVVSYTETEDRIYIYSMMQLDDGTGSNCGTRKVSYSGLQDGNHTFEVCTNGPQGIGCALHNWTVGKEPFPYPF